MSSQFEFILYLAPIDDFDAAVERLGDAECTDSQISESCGEVTLEFAREGNTLREAILSAIADVQKAGLRTIKVEAEDSRLVEQMNLELSNGSNWKQPDGCSSSLMSTFTRIFHEMDTGAAFPDLRKDDDLAIAADYSGEHESSKYRILTFLLTDRSSIVDGWEQTRLEIRKRHLPDQRTFAFKKLNDALLQKALFPFLDATSRLNGIIFSVALDKRLATSTLGFQTDAAGLKQKVLSKLVQIAAFGSLLVGGLSRPGQQLRWITDDDETVSNEAAVAKAGHVIASLLDLMAARGLVPASIGISSKFDDLKRAEDLCAIPDLVGGALCEFIEAFPGELTPGTSQLTIPTARRLSTKSTLVLGWLRLAQGNLKHMLAVIRPGTQPRELDISIPNLVFYVDPSRLHLPPDKGWKAAIDLQRRS